MPSGSAKSYVRPAGHFSKNATTSLSAFGRGLRLWGPVAALILLCIGFGVADPGFATIKNLPTVADRSAIPLIVAIGMTFIVLQGSIDLSIEGVMASSSLTFAMTVLNSRTALDLGVAGILLATAVGGVLGLVNGLVVTKLRVPSFMVTLGIWSVSMGIAMLISGGQPPIIRDQMLRALGLGHSHGVPNLTIVAVVCLLVGYVLQTYTRFGRYSFVIGGGEDLARLSGIPVDRYKVLVFGFSGVMAGLAGVMEFRPHRSRPCRYRPRPDVCGDHRRRHRWDFVEWRTRRRTPVCRRGSDPCGARQRDDLCWGFTLPSKGGPGRHHPSGGSCGDLAFA